MKKNKLPTNYLIIYL